jgi:tetratricopeptide (TPR) repeat protein
MPDRLAKRVLLLGWDAADWQFLLPMIERGEMPTLQRLMARGVSGNIATLNPIISPILWNSIASGKRADKHDILGFMEPDGHGSVRPVSSTSRKCKALWNILSQNGLRSCVVGWFASYPAEKVRGVVITDRFQRTHGEIAESFPLDEKSVHPVDLAETLGELRVHHGDVTGEQAAMFVPRIAEIDHATSEYPAALAKLISECATIHNAGTYLADCEEWDLLAVYYDAVDHFGHGFMEFNPPKMDHVSERDFGLYQQVMNSVYRWHDLMLKRYLELVGPETTVIVMSDHGFQSGPNRPRIFVDPETGRKHGAGMNPVAWHRSHGIFVAAGPGIRQGIEVQGLSLLDVCPTVLTLLGLPVGEDMDGVVQTQIFDRPVKVATIPTHEGEHPDDGVFRGEWRDDPYAAMEVMKQLADLGYVEAPGEDAGKSLEIVLRDRKSTLAQTLFSAGRTEEAARLLEELVAAYPTAEFKTRLAMCHLQQSRFDRADEVLRGIGEDVTANPVTAVLRSQVLFGIGKVDEAGDLLQKVADFGVRFQRLHTQLGAVRLKQGRLDEAAAAYRRAIEVDPDDAEAHDGLGIALRLQGRYEDAVHQHMKAIALNGRVGMTHVHLGLALAQAQQIDWAIRAFEEGARLDPENPFPHRCLYQVYKRAKRDMERAREHMSRALTLRAELNKREVLRAETRGTWT